MRHTRAVRSVTLVALGLICTVSVGGAATTHRVSIRIFRAGAIASPVAITAGPDGAVWFTNEQTGSIGRITIGGIATSRTSAEAVAAGTIVSGRDGALWFADGGTLGRITPTGTPTEYPGVNAVDLAAGPDGALWFTTGGKSVGRVAPTGEVTSFVDTQRFRGTYGIARGPDGAMWVTNYLGSSIARVDADGAVTRYAAPCVRYPTGITAGPDGALWFADDSGAIGRIDTAGQIACFGNAASVGHPDAIVAGGDGALWATDRNGSIVRITTRGVVTRYATGAMRYPVDIAAGPRGTVWFADYSASSVGRISWTGQPARPSRPRALPRVTFISDSVAAAIAYDTGAKAILERGVDLFFEPGEARTLGPGPTGGIAPPTVLELIGQLGRRLGRTVVVEVGNNDYPGTYAANMEAALTALRAAGVEHVLWTTLHVTPDHLSYETINAAIAAEAAQHPELTILDWNTYGAAHPEWFQPDGVHLAGDGARALARFIRAGIGRALSPTG